MNRCHSFLSTASLLASFSRQSKRVEVGWLHEGASPHLRKCGPQLDGNGQQARQQAGLQLPIDVQLLVDRFAKQEDQDEEQEPQGVVQDD